MKAMTSIIFLATLFFSVACSSQPSVKQPLPADTTSANSDVVAAYYFHFTARCVTCKTIEADTKKNLEALYPEHTRAGVITFQSLNLDEEPARAIAERLGVSGQTLLLVKGDQKINLTNEGFMYAVPKPEKFREVINEKVEFLLAGK